MTKHLTLLMIKRHIASLFLEFVEGRSDKAAKLHSVTRMLRQESAVAKLQSADESSQASQGEIIGQKEVKQADGYESILTQESHHSYLGKSQADQVERPG